MNIGLTRRSTGLPGAYKLRLQASFQEDSMSRTTRTVQNIPQVMPCKLL